MKRCFTVLFVLISMISFAQANRPTTFSFDSLTEYIRNFEFIASGTALPAIQTKGIKFLLWSNEPIEYISDGTNWFQQNLTAIEKDTALNGSDSVDLKTKDLTIYGEMELDESALVYDDNAITLSNVRLNPTQEPSWSNYKGSQVLAFSSTQTNTVFFSTQLPHRYKPGKNIEYHIHIAYPSATLATSTWEFTYSWASVNEETFPSETTITKNVLSSGVTDKHIMQNISMITGTNKSESSVLLCSLKRIGGNASDTYDSSIYLLSADFHFPINKLGELDGHF